MNRVYNFNAGPATLPLEVLEEARAELLDYKGTGMSIMEASHRSKAYDEVHNQALETVRELLNLSNDYAVLLLHGGASTQFAMAPMNLAGIDNPPDYTITGSWSKKAIKEAKIVSGVNVAVDTTGTSPARIPQFAELQLRSGAPYLHLTSNETIEGTQWKDFPEIDAPLVADMSSDILSRPFDVSKFGLIYAGAQKNLGPSGVGLVIIRKDLAERASDKIPTMFRYSTHIEKNSLFNTPPTFSIYMVGLVLKNLRKLGGLTEIAAHNKQKAARIYAVIDGSDFYRGTAEVASRSDMNVTFRLPSEELEAKFIKEAEENSLCGLKGHRSVGGCRASIYNSFPQEGIDVLVSFMTDFAERNG